MKKIIVASVNKDAAQRVKRILSAGGFQTEGIFSSGAEVLSYASIRPEAVVVCGRLSDMSPVMLADMIPQGFDIISLLPSGQAQTVFRSNLISLYMPINTSEFLSSVRTLAVTDSQSFQRKKIRPEEERRLISGAKQIVMARHHISESQAHKILQKRSMDSGIPLIEVASLIMGENE